eukprot:SAG31_NODE_1532_length_7990_cov_8.692941_10_plen_219_part_00
MDDGWGVRGTDTIPASGWSDDSGWGASESASVEWSVARDDWIDATFATRDDWIDRWRDANPDFDSRTEWEAPYKVLFEQALQEGLGWEGPQEQPASLQHLIVLQIYKKIAKITLAAPGWVPSDRFDGFGLTAEEAKMLWLSKLCDEMRELRCSDIEITCNFSLEPWEDYLSKEYWEYRVRVSRSLRRMQKNGALKAHHTNVWTRYFSYDQLDRNFDWQ